MKLFAGIPPERHASRFLDKAAPSKCAIEATLGKWREFGGSPAFQPMRKASPNNKKNELRKHVHIGDNHRRRDKRLSFVTEASGAATLLIELATGYRQQNHSKPELVDLEAKILLYRA